MRNARLTYTILVMITMLTNENVQLKYDPLNSLKPKLAKHIEFRGNLKRKVPYQMAISKAQTNQTNR